MAAFRTASPAEAALKPLLPDSLAAFALPVFYAEQLHGILYVESSVPVDFSEEEILLLRTLADLIAGALHNALSFQKAQEQAITDGLTGVKTHRFFMEALSAEWKRSTRAGRAFALVLMDLDRKSSSKWPTLGCIFRSTKAATPFPPPITSIPTKRKNGSVTSLKRIWG